MLIFQPLFRNDRIFIEDQLFHIVNGHKHDIRSHKLNIPGHPFHRIELFKEGVAVASHYFDLVVSLLVNELLEEHPDVVEFRHSFHDVAGVVFDGFHFFNYALHVANIFLRLLYFDILIGQLVLLTVGQANHAVEPAIHLVQYGHFGPYLRHELGNSILELGDLCVNAFLHLLNGVLIITLKLIQSLVHVSCNYTNSCFQLTKQLVCFT